MAVRSGEPRQRLPLSELDQVVLAPVLSPMPTVVEAARDLVGKRPPRVISEWQRRWLHATLTRRHLLALGALRPTWAASDGGPNELMEAVEGATMREELERIGALDADALAGAIDQATGTGRPTEPWAVVRAQPRRWLDDYVSALRVVWDLIGALWQSAGGRLDQEVERLVVASTKRATSEVVAQVQTPGEILDGDLLLPSHTRRSGRLRVGGSLRLVPLLATPPAGGWGDDYESTVSTLRYPVTPNRAGSRPQDSRAPESLDGLLGVSRAMLLRALDGPRQPGALAERLHLSPSGVSYHLDALESARLIVRIRRGRDVLVHRTARATALLELYE